MDWCWAKIIREFLSKPSINIISLPPYSPDLAACEFWLFLKFKRPRRENRFESIEEIQRKSTQDLKAVLGNEYPACIEDWKTRRYKCVVSGGDYFEGEEIDLDE